jgi:Ca2+-binding EF-hand superfamily protein
LNRIGLSIEDSFRNRDPKRSGHLRKKSIISVFRQLGIPLGTKDLLLVCRGYLNSQNSDLVDYERLLHDSMVSIVRADGSQSLEGSLSAEATFDENKMHRNVLVDLKFALRDAVDSLGKSLDDIYGVFFKWDSKGVGISNLLEL